MFGSNGWKNNESKMCWIGMKVDGLDICYIRNAETRFEEEKKCFISNCEQKKVEVSSLRQHITLFALLSKLSLSLKWPCGPSLYQVRLLIFSNLYTW